MRPAAKGSKITKRQHLEQLEKSGIPQEELRMPTLDGLPLLLWEWFLEVQTGERLTWQEIEAWKKATGKVITATEAESVRKISFIHHDVTTSEVK